MIARVIRAGRFIELGVTPDERTGADGRPLRMKPA